MRKSISMLLFATLTASLCLAQVGGSAAAYQPGQANSKDQNERAKRVISKDDMPPNSSGTFIDASVLMNVKADEYVAVFGVNEEGSTPAECEQKVDTEISKFSDELRKLGVAPAEVYVDFVAQNRIYGYDLTPDAATEKMKGFELKKNVSIHYRDKSLLDAFVSAAARSQIFDLVKVDYLVRDTDAIEAKLMDEAMHIVKGRAATYDRLGIKLHASQIYAQRHSAYFPSEQYDAYQAFETGDVAGGYDVRRSIVHARKNKTFYFNALNAKTFDHVINPVVLEPVVQFTLYLKVLYERDPGKTLVKIAGTKSSKK